LWGKGVCASHLPFLAHYRRVCSALFLLKRRRAHVSPARLDHPPLGNSLRSAITLVPVLMVIFNRGHPPPDLPILSRDGSSHLICLFFAVVSDTADDPESPPCLFAVTLSAACASAANHATVSEVSSLLHANRSSRYLHHHSLDVCFSRADRVIKSFLRGSVFVHGWPFPMPTDNAPLDMYDTPSC